MDFFQRCVGRALPHNANGGKFPGPFSCCLWTLLNARVPSLSAQDIPDPFSVVHHQYSPVLPVSRVNVSLKRAGGRVCLVMYHTIC